MTLYALRWAILPRGTDHKKVKLIDSRKDQKSVEAVGMLKYPSVSSNSRIGKEG
jgi:hypothetical protein